MTAIKNYQMSFLTFELCTPLPCIVLHLHYRLRESILCSVTSRCETYSLIKKDIYCSQTRSTLTLLNSKTNRCKIHTVVKKTKKNGRELATLNCREFSSPQLQILALKKSFKSLVSHLTVIVLLSYGEFNRVQRRHKSSSVSFMATGPDNPSITPLINLLKFY